MSENEADRSAKQFHQSMPERSKSGRSEYHRPESARLHDQYKPVGISAVSAAAHFTKKPGKKNQQMS